MSSSSRDTEFERQIYTVSPLSFVSPQGRTLNFENPLGSVGSETAGVVSGVVTGVVTGVVLGVVSAVGVAEGVVETVGLLVGVVVGVPVTVGIGASVLVGSAVGVEVGLLVGVGDTVGDGETVGNGVFVAFGVAVGVSVISIISSGVGVGLSGSRIAFTRASSSFLSHPVSLQTLSGEGTREVLLQIYL